MPGGTFFHLILPRGNLDKQTVLLEFANGASESYTRHGG